MKEIIISIGNWTYRFLWTSEFHILEVEKPLEQMTPIAMDRESFMSCLQTIMFAA